MILCDFGTDTREFSQIYENATIRRHPAEEPCAESLSECLQSHERAIGAHTTALVDAAVLGLGVECTALDGPISGLKHGRKHWINCLAWHNWTLEEIRAGDTWEHLNDNAG